MTNRSNSKNKGNCKTKSNSKSLTAKAVRDDSQRYAFEFVIATKSKKPELQN